MPDPDVLSVAEMRTIIGDKAVNTILEHWRKSRMPSPRDVEAGLRWVAGSRTKADIEAVGVLATTWLETSRSRRTFVTWLEQFPLLPKGAEPVQPDDQPEPEEEAHVPVTHDTSGGVVYREPADRKAIAGLVPL